MGTLSTERTNGSNTNDAPYPCCAKSATLPPQQNQRNQKTVSMWELLETVACLCPQHTSLASSCPLGSHAVAKVHKLDFSANQPDARSELIYLNNNCFVSCSSCRPSSRGARRGRLRTHATLCRVSTARTMHQRLPPEEGNVHIFLLKLRLQASICLIQ